MGDDKQERDIPPELEGIMDTLQTFIKLQFDKMQRDVKKQIDKIAKEVQEHINNTDRRIRELDKAVFDQYCVTFTFKKLLIGDQPGMILNEKKFEEMVVEIATASIEAANLQATQKQKEG